MVVLLPPLSVSHLPFNSPTHTCQVIETAASGVQMHVSETLRVMGLTVEDEFRCPHSGYSIDMLVHAGGSTFAVEFDGPTHFLRMDFRAERDLQPAGRLRFSKVLLTFASDCKCYVRALMFVKFVGWQDCDQAPASCHARLLCRQYSFLGMGSRCFQGPKRGVSSRLAALVVSWWRLSLKEYFRTADGVTRAL